MQGVTFACINAAAVPGEEGAAQQGGDAGKGADQKAGGKDAAASAASGKLGTFAFRVQGPLCWLQGSPVAACAQLSWSRRLA